MVGGNKLPLAGRAEGLRLWVLKVAFTWFLLFSFSKSSMFALLRLISLILALGGRWDTVAAPGVCKRQNLARRWV